MKIKESFNNFKTKHEKGLKVAKKIGTAVGTALVGGAIGYVIGVKTGWSVGGGETLEKAVTDGVAEVVENVTE